MGNFATQLAQGAAQQATGGILGMVAGGIQRQGEYKQARRMQALQIRGAKEMGEYNYQQQMRMWDATNYHAQVEQLKKAGLNPALLYGMSGGGGTTTGQTGTMPTAGSIGTGGGEVVSGMGMGIQGGLAAAQAEVLKSQARLNNVEADKKEGIDTELAKTNMDSIIQGIQNQKAAKLLTEAQTKVTNLEAQVKEKSVEDAINYIAWQTGRALYDMEKAQYETWITKATQNDIIDTIHANAVQAALQHALTKAQTANTKMDTTSKLHGLAEIAARIVAMAKNASTNQTNADTNRESMINEVSKETGLPQNIIGDILDAIILRRLLPGTPAHTPVKGFGK